MKKYLLMLFAALFTFSMSFAETGTETEKEATGGASSNAQVDGQSYYVAGTYIAGKGSAQTGSMTSKGFKLRTGSDNKRVVFTVQTGYTITSLSLTGASNYALNDGGTKEVSVVKVEVDGAEVSFTGGEAFKDRSIGESCTVTISDIEAKESIAIYFDNGDSKGSQINGTWSISWQRPDATQPTITVTPDKVALVPGATFKLGLRVDPNTFTTKWVSANENIATVSEDGTVTAVAAGEVAIRNEWDTNAEVFGAATINVSDFNAASYLVAKSYDFTAMGDVTLTIGENAAAKIWNEANSVANNVFFCTNAGLEDIAVQAVLSGGKGWSIVDGAGLQLAGGAGRCAAIGNLKAGQVVEIIYTGNNFYTGSKADDKRKDDGALKTALNQGVGRAIYCMDEDGFLGFEIEKGKVVSKITVYEKETLVTVPETAELQDWTFDGSFNTNSGTKAVQNPVKVAIVGNDIYAQGFAYYFPEAYLKGTIDGTKVTFATGQLVGEDEYGKEYMLGIASDGQTISDIVFDYDAEAQKLTLSAATPYIAENAAKDALSMYGYWTKVSIYAGEPVVPELVELPEGAEVQEYSMAYTDSNNAAATKPVKVAVVGTDVYFQGMSQYLPEAWVKGTISDNVVTFPGNQYMGEYGSYGSSYFFYNGETTFTYDAEKDTYTATGKVFGVLAEQYYDGNYTNPVLSKVAEVAATPATPSITGIEASNYGDVLTFTIPTVDVDGNALVTSKLSYQFFIDDESTPMVFTPEYFTKLTEDMTVIPYGFTDNYDIADGFIYLNMPHDTWTRIGVQSIYAGAGVENKSEISWFEMPEGPVTAPADLETETYTFSANAKTYGVENEEFEPYSILVQVGFDGDDAYIQGLAVDMPELWVKATKNAEGKYVIPANQYMGDLSFYGYTFPYYWTGLDADENLVDAVLDFNAETSTFTSQQTMALNGAADELEYYQLYNNVVITKFIEVAATPADPTFEKFDIESEYPEINASVATVGTNGEVLNPDKLFYIVWVDKNGEVAPHTFTAALYPKDFTEDMVEVPYTHDGYDLYLGGEIIYLEEPLEELQTWTKVGIQSVYYGAGERRESNIVWSTDTQGISNVKTVDDKAVIFDLQGRRVAVPAKGLYIINGKKVVVK